VIIRLPGVLFCAIILSLVVTVVAIFETITAVTITAAAVRHIANVLRQVRAGQSGPQFVVCVLTERIQIEPHRAAEQGGVLSRKV